MKTERREVSAPRSTASIERQRRVTDHFEAESAFWRDVYVEPSAWGTIFSERRDLSLALVDQLELPAEARILEVGCGAGSMTAALARRRYRVDAIDSSEAMVRLTREHTDELDLGKRVTVAAGDVHELPFDDDVFDVVVALGVIPWLHSPARGMSEMARVMKPGGHLIFTSDNRAAAHHLLDPRFNPVLVPLKHLVKRLLQRTISWQRPETTHTYPARFVNRLISDAGLARIRMQTIGFGPFSFLGRELLPQRTGIRLHRFLQRLAERQFPVIRSIGGQHLVLARKL
jgi:ubiquinone/menaquinone biosynthesis C-methylase UbiE